MKGPLDWDDIRRAAEKWENSADLHWPWLGIALFVVLVMLAVIVAQG